MKQISSILLSASQKDTKQPVFQKVYLARIVHSLLPPCMLGPVPTAHLRFAQLALRRLGIARGALAISTLAKLVHDGTLTSA